MVDILHRIATTQPPEKVYAALTTLDGLRGWWSSDTTGDPDGTLLFRFGEVGFAEVKVLETTPGERVRWEVTGGPEEWIGTTLTFDLERDGEWTVLRFTHGCWREPVEFMGHCSTKWAVFLMSLKTLVESGAGQPHPRDVQISNWH